MAKQKPAGAEISLGDRRYTLKRHGAYKVKGLQVDEELWERFKALAREMNLRAYQAHDFAIQDFIHKYSKKS